MTRILDTTLPRDMRAHSAAIGHGGFRIHRACDVGYVLPASVGAEMRADYRLYRRAGRPVNDARSRILVYLDGYVAGWRGRGHADTDYPVQPGSDAWYDRQAASA